MLPATNSIQKDDQKAVGRLHFRLQPRLPQALTDHDLRVVKSATDRQNVVSKALLILFPISQREK